MPTTAESRALAFFAGLFALGGALRAASIWREASPRAPGADSIALAQHLETVDAARRAPTAKPARRAGAAAGRRAATAASTDSLRPPPAGVPPELAAVAGWYLREPRAPGPRVGDGAVAGRTAPTGRPRGRRAEPGVAGPAHDASSVVDLDLADEATIEALPGIGPSLARRLVADRAQHGPFGSLDGLARVKGVGPVLRARLADRVTFSGIARPE